MHLVTFKRHERKRRDHSRPPSGGASAMDGPLDLDGHTGVRQLGAVLQRGTHAGWVVDLNRALAIKLAYDDAGAPEAEADSLLPSDVISFLRRGPTSREAARVALEFACDSLDRYDAPDVVRAGAVEPQSDLELSPPIPRPGKIIGVSGVRSEAAGEPEAARRVPELFLKAPTAVIGPDDEIELPDGAAVDFGGELAVVIGAPTRNVTEEEALGSIAGYCAAAELTARAPAWEAGSIGKSFDTFSPLGPALVTADEVPRPDELGIRSVVSGEVLHVSSTKALRFPVGSIVAFASSIMTLEPGDVILTGAPSAPERIGERRWLRDGDLIEVEIDALGRLRNFVTLASRRKPRQR